jgi:2-polyprenyl-3-methyl-5-hydroxy-6-metoxy-1,4-benzoquinol methylase
MLMQQEFGRNYFYGGNRSNYFNYEKMNHSKVFQGIAYFFNKHGIRGNRLLDAGCAFGFLLRELSPFFKNLTGFDISEFAIKKARKIIPEANLSIFNLHSDLLYPDNHFDCVTAVDVLEHTRDFGESFGKLVGKLRKGGYLVVSTPLDRWPRRYFGFIGDRDKTHISVPREKELNNIIQQNKLHIIERRYFSPFPILYRIPTIPWQVEILMQKK